MASIKVTYGEISRKFTIASNTTWSEFESQLHDLFNIPNETAISVSYVDEDGDVITLSTDSELQQILSEQESFGANVRFNVYTSENPDNNNNGWVLEDAEGKEESVTTISDDENFPNKDEEIVAYNISEPSETENTDIKQVSNEEQQPAVEINYPHVTVTNEDDDPLFKSSAPNEKQSEGSSIPINSVSEEKGQNQENSTEPSNETENSSSTSTEPSNETEKSSSTLTEPSNETEKSSPGENNEESDNDSNFIFIISSSPWIQRTYYRPRVGGLFGGLLSGYPTHFSHFARPRYTYVTPSYGFRRYPHYRSRDCRFSRYNNGFGGGLYNSLLY